MLDPSNLPSSPLAWVVAIALVVALVCAENLFTRWGYWKPEKEVSPGWAYARFRLLMIGVLVGGFLIYYLFTKLA
jgi:hypothetical protein